MNTSLALRARLFPFVRNGDFTFDLRPGLPRVRRYFQSFGGALVDGRLPFARALVVASTGARWRAAWAEAQRHALPRHLLDHEGVLDAWALREFEGRLQGDRARAGAFALLFERGDPLASFRTMKIAADIAYGVVGQETHCAWWVY